MVFDIVMWNFHKMAHLMTGGHVTNTSDDIPYSSVVTREIVFIALTLAVLHDLEIKAADC